MSQLQASPPELQQVLPERRFQVGARSFTAIDAGAGPLVVCVHGFPDNHRSWYLQVPALVAAGYRVVCPLLPGYEPESQLPLGRYDMDAVSGELLNWLELLQPEPQQPVHLVGHDWGALAGYAAVCKAPRKFRSFTALSIPYNLSLGRMLLQAPAYLQTSWYIQLFQLRGVAEWLMERDDWALLERLWRHWSPHWRMPEARRVDIKRTLAQPGVNQSALAYYRAIYGVDAGARQARRLLNAEIEVPSLLIEGASDGCIHADLWHLLQPQSFTAGLRLEKLQAGHFPQQEVSTDFNRLLLDWLSLHA